MSDDITCIPQPVTDYPDDDEPWFCDVTDSDNLHQREHIEVNNNNEREHFGQRSVFLENIE